MHAMPRVIGATVPALNFEYMQGLVVIAAAFGVVALLALLATFAVLFKVRGCSQSSLGWLSQPFPDVSKAARL
jgi:hypothetical protein